MRLIFTTYLVISISVMGFFLINPKEIKNYDHNFKKTIEYDYLSFKYSLLISILVGIILISYSGYIKNKTNDKTR